MVEANINKLNKKRKNEDGLISNTKKQKSVPYLQCTENAKAVEKALIFLN